MTRTKAIEVLTEMQKKTVQDKYTEQDVAEWTALTMAITALKMK